MKSKVFILLCGIVAWTQATTECGCTDLETCVEQKKTAMEATFHDCAQQCNSTLGAAAAKLDACWQKAKAEAAPYEQEFGNCFFNASNNVCAGSRRKRDDGGDEHDGGADEHGGNGDEHDDHREGEGGHDDHKCKGHKDWRKSPISKKMWPFYNCTMQCLHKKHNVNGHAEGHKDDHHEHYMRNAQRHHCPPNPAVFWVMSCEKEKNCTLNKDAVKPALKTCWAGLKVSPTEFAAFKKSNCECFRDALDIKATDMTCDPHEND